MQGYERSECAKDGECTRTRVWFDGFENRTVVSVPGAGDATDSRQHATRNMQHATRNRQHAFDGFEHRELVIPSRSCHSGCTHVYVYFAAAVSFGMLTSRRPVPESTTEYSLEYCCSLLQWFSVLVSTDRPMTAVATDCGLTVTALGTSRKRSMA